MFTEARNVLDHFCTNQIIVCLKLKEFILDVKYGGCEVRSDYVYKWVCVGFKPPNLSAVNPILDTKTFTKEWLK